MAIVVPVDPIDLVVKLLNQEVMPILGYAGMKAGGPRLTPGVTPNNYVRVSVVGNQDYHRVGDRVAIRVQVWKSGPDSTRNKVANELIAQLRARLVGRKDAGPISLPDQATPTTYLTQFEMTILLIGVQQ